MSDLQEPNQFPATPTLHQPKDSPVFFGRFGMRAGWGLLIFAPLAFLSTLFGAMMGLVFSGQMHQMIAARTAHQTSNISFVPSLAYGQDGIGLAALLLLTWIFSRAEHRKFAVFGIGKSRIADFIPGAITGLLAMSVLVFTLRHFGWLVFEGQSQHGITAFLWGAKWLIAFLFVGLCEEYMFRGYIQYTLMRGVWGLAEKLSPTNPRPVAFWISACFWSFLFAASHLGNSGETAIGLVQVAAAGITLAYGLWRTGSLWWSIGMHTTWDWAQSFLFGVPDSGSISVGRLFASHPTGNPMLSGGTDGPEGSLLGLPVLLLVILVVHFTMRPGLQPPIEQETISLPPEHAEPIA